MNLNHRKYLSIAAILVAAPLALAGCSSPATDAAPAGEQQSSADHADAAVVMTDGWVKSAEEGGMTGVFGTLENHGEEDLVIESVESDAAGLVELHEVTAAGVMQEIDGEVSIPAGGALELAPGADHIMLMELQRDLLAGEDVSVILTFAGGGSFEFTAPVKDYSGANEEYGEDHGDHDHADHDHGEHGDHEH